MAAKEDEMRTQAFDMFGLRRILLRVSWTANSKNEWALEKAEVEKIGCRTLKRERYHISGT